MCGWSGFFAYTAAAIRCFPSIVRSRSLQPADKGLKEKLWTFRVRDATVTLPTRYFSAARELYGRRVYFPNDRFAIDRGTTVVDLGCNEGLFSVLAAQWAARVIAVDAQSGFDTSIREHAAANGCSQRIVYVLGMLGGGTGLLANEEALKASSHFGIHPPNVPMRDLMRSHNISEINFLKIDIEGSEFGLFSGDLSWLPSVKRIAMEVHPKFGNPGDLVDVLYRNNFATLLLTEDQRVLSKVAGRPAYLFATNNAFH
jgi:FkbM family methyltransferase